MTEPITAIDPLAGIEVLTHIVEQHADEAAFCWEFRDAAATSPAYNLNELCGVDDRLEAHLDGLRVAGDAGWQLCLEKLDEDEPGSHFVAALLALERQDMPGLATVLDSGAEQPNAARAIVSALGWLPYQQVERPLRALVLPQGPASLRRIGIAAYAAHRIDPGPCLADAARANDPALRARALRAIGQLGSQGHDATLRHGYQDHDANCAFWASWSSAVLGDGHAIRNLMAIAEHGNHHAEQAADLAVRRMDPARAAAWLRDVLSSNMPQPRAALIGAAALGLPAMLPRLIEQMHKPELARLAAFAFSQISGANVTDELDSREPAPLLTGPSDDPDDDNVDMDPDEDLPWPDLDKITQWWSQSGIDTNGSARLLLAKPMAPSWLNQVLAGPERANQLARRAAALELALRGRAAYPYEVRSAGYGQLSLRGGG